MIGTTTFVSVKMPDYINLFWCYTWDIPFEITHSKNGIFFIVITQSVHPMRVHNAEYQPPVTSGSRVTGCANFVN